jgi:hypothetical protein
MGSPTIYELTENTNKIVTEFNHKVDVLNTELQTIKAMIERIGSYTRTNRW